MLSARRKLGTDHLPRKDEHSRSRSEHEYLIAETLAEQGWDNPFEKGIGGHGASAFMVVFQLGPWTRDALLATMPTEDIYDRVVVMYTAMQVLGALFGLVMLEQGLAVGDFPEPTIHSGRSVACRALFLLSSILFLLPVFQIAVVFTTINTVPKDKLRRWLLDNSRMAFFAGNLEVGGLFILNLAVALKLSLIFDDGSILQVVVPIMCWLTFFIAMKLIVVSAVEFNQAAARPWKEATDPTFLSLVFLTREDLFRTLVGYTENCDREGLDIEYPGFQHLAVKERTAKQQRMSQLSFALIGAVFEEFQRGYADHGGYKTPVEVASDLLEGELMRSSMSRLNSLGSTPGEAISTVAQT